MIICSLSDNFAKVLCNLKAAKSQKVFSFSDDGTKIAIEFFFFRWISLNFWRLMKNIENFMNSWKNKKKAFVLCNEMHFIDTLESAVLQSFKGSILDTFVETCWPFIGWNMRNIYKYLTPPVAEILCVKNGRAIVVCGFVANKIIEKKYAESLKKIVGAVWELPAK